ncbi:MAG: hypothetical protein M3Y13_12415 [Armatimonadota bacterium]|nr:hypothetical protein [Armatimonadota bacterium]
MTTLAELRQASLQEQKRRAPEPAPLPEYEERIEAASSQSAVASNGHHAAHSAEPPMRAPAPPAVEAVALPAPPVEVILAPVLPQTELLLARMREALSQKTIHPTGAKATVDMSPALFHRAKRYCLDHNNITLRQLALDLLTAFLDEEGY